MSNQRVLLKGGIVLQHDSDDNVKVRYDTDLLIKDGLIAQIGQKISHDQDIQVIDCAEKIISPGFIDTHRHTWQTQLKGRHSDDTLLNYHPKGNLQFWNYNAEEVFWGELGGLMEGIDGGTTTIVDHAHMSLTPHRTLAGFAATRASGIRSIFCPSLVPQIQRWDKDGYQVDASLVPDWVLPQIKDLCEKTSEPEDRIMIGLGFDAFFLPKQSVIDFIQTARKHGVKLITSHWRRNTIAGSGAQTVPGILRDYGLLGPDILLSHGTGSTEQEFAFLKEAGAAISSTPGTEAQMAHGEIVGFRDDVIGSLGADCHSSNPASLLHAMQIGLAVTRSYRNSRILAQNKFPLHPEPSTLEAFNLATIQGARSIRMDDKIGSLQVGKRADIIIFSTDSPSMLCAVDHDPLVAVVRHASNSDIEVVMVDGQFLKRDGKLLDVDVREPEAFEGINRVSNIAENGKLSWPHIAKELRRSRKDIQARIGECDVNAAREKVMQMWGFSGDESTFA